MSEQSKAYHSIVIGDKNTWDDWHIVPTSRPLVNPPPVKKEYVNIPGRNGSLDYTEVLAGEPLYDNRTGSWEFVVLNGYQEWYVLYNSIMSYLHGKEFDIYLEDEPTYSYHGRLSLNEWRSEKDNSKITIDYNLEPFKKLSEGLVEDWKWDDLTFYSDDYTIMYGSFRVDGERIRNVYNQLKEQTVLGMTLSSPMTIDYAGIKYGIPAGTYPETSIILSPGNNTMTFSGNGVVILNYKRGENLI